MEEKLQPPVLEGEIVGIRFGLATHKEICTASVSECPISHSSQLTNPFLGLPLESGKCESCGASEVGQCEGHFGYMELPIPIYHPSHVAELKRLLSLLCLKCLKMKRNKVQMKPSGIAERMLSCCEEASQVSIRDYRTTDGAWLLQLKVPSRSKPTDDLWNFLERYGFRYGQGHSRTLLPCEAMEMLKRISEDTRKKLSKKGYFPQDGYILQYLPIPPNCLSVPDISDGVSVMAADLSTSVLKKVLKHIETIKSSRSGPPNFQSHQVEVVDLQSAVDQYLQIRGMTKSSRDADGARFGVRNESSESATKTWLEKMKTLFIRKGSGFSSRTVITGDAYTEVSEIGIPLEIAQRITIEERVNDHNIRHLQELVDNKLCLTYRDGSTRFSLREGSKGHTSLRVGQVVHRRIVDGDIVFVNRPPTTHKHALQALSVYVHDDHVVKINPLICGPLSADFDGDCIHLFYPQSVAAKSEALELFALGKQLLSSHSGNLILQLSADTLLSLKTMLKSFFYDRAAAQQLSMFLSNSLAAPSLLKAKQREGYWTALQILQSTLPASFECSEDRYMISKSEILKVDHDRDVLQNILNEVATSIFFQKGPEAVVQFFNSVQPLLMENLYSKGFSISLEDFSLSENIRKQIQKDFKVISPQLASLRSSYNEQVELKIENCIQQVKRPVVDFILKWSALADLIHSKSDSGVKKVVEQIGFLGLQISDQGKLYTKVLVEDAASLFVSKYPSDVEYPSAQYGLVKSCFFRGLDPYEEMIHSISSREVMLRSSRGLSEPGTLFKNLMAVLRDVVICYDDTVRNVCSDLIIQFQYGETAGTKFQSSLAAGEPVGVLAATAMSNPAYKAVLDSSPNSNSSWELMKEILLCKVGFKNNQNDRRVILYLNECGCGRKYCQEKAAYQLKNHLEKVSLKDTAKSFMIEYTRQPNDFGMDSGLVGHIHLTKGKLQSLKIGMNNVLQKCQDTINLLGKRKKELGKLYKMTTLSVSDCCSFQQSSKDESLETPCLMFCLGETYDSNLEKTIECLAERICPVLMETIVKGDERVSSANIIWASPDTTSWIRNPSRAKEGELALDVVLEKKAVKQSGDAWRTVLDSCLPLLHLIDTTRSVPYAIKQIQDLLGISCAFDQAVQRLSTSVTMVAKGLLKEHLFLLANSMTCSGNLLGFNPGGIKALSRSLDIQAPFTEATLYTPKKCFERAAEKCHVDPLSSIVASCSWGKPVAVGTGSRFDILWDTKESIINQNKSVEIYEFLNMLRTTQNGEEIPGSLGVVPEDEFDDWNMSPERESGTEKPTFEDSAELCIADNADSSWDIGAGKEQETSVWGAAASKKQEESGWDLKSSMTNDQKESDEQQPWSSWGAATTRKQEESCKSDWDTNVSTSGALEVPGEQRSLSGWGAAGSRTQAEPEKSTWDKPAAWQTSEKNEADKRGSDWTAKANTEEEHDKQPWSGWKSNETGTPVEPEKSSWNNTAAWQSSGKNEAVNSGSDWTAAPKVREQHDQQQSWGGWKAAATTSQDKSGQSSGSRTAAWETNKKPESDKPGSDWSVDASNERNKHQSSSGWGAATKENDKTSQDEGGSHGWGSQKPAGGSDGWGVQSTGGDNSSDGSQQHGWGSQKPVGASGGWGSQKPASGSAGWGSQKPASDSKGWGSQKPASDSEGWGSQKPASGSDGWGSQKPASGSDGWGSQKPASGSDGWGSQKPASGSDGWGSQKPASDSDGWGSQKPASGSDGWGSQKPASGSDGWGSPKPSAGSEGWGSQKPASDSDGWGSQKPASGSDGWGSQKPASGSDGWGSPKPSAGSGGWGGRQKDGDFKKNRREGWGNNPDWKPRKNFPPKSPGFGREENTGFLYTATRQRLDMFNTEEQAILAIVEPLMLAIRRIMHTTGYNDGDRLSADDQSYIVDNVFNYHPDKAAKTGAGMDYITISKHTNFQDTRCFYVVSTDGSREDFSYRKCLENYIKEKYPDLAEEFNGKYFAKRNNNRPAKPESQSGLLGSIPETPPGGGGSSSSPFAS
ncbi:DNA-directed RNA polymerase V subunit 1 [Linum grandiflorum]